MNGNESVVDLKVTEYDLCISKQTCPPPILGQSRDEERVLCPPGLEVLLSIEVKKKVLWFSLSHFPSSYVIA